MKFKTKINRKFREATAKYRTLPNFIIIGAQKAGTSSLFEYLREHPQVAVPFRKEIHYFDLNYLKGLNWYKWHFPLLFNKKKSLRFEATPCYMINPIIPKRMALINDQIKIIIMLREPIHRAYSHYQHNLRIKNRENRSFEKAIEDEIDYIPKIIKRIYEDHNYVDINFYRYSYLFRGLYYNQILNWYKYFDSQLFYFVKSEDFFNNPEFELNSLYEFLGLPKINYEKFDTINQGNYNFKINKKTLEFLYKYYNQPNINLANLLGEKIQISIQLVLKNKS